MDINKGRKVSLDEVNKILLMAQGGMRGGDIGVVLDRSSSIIYRVLKSYGIPVLPRDRTTGDIERAFVQHRTGNKPWLGKPVEPEITETKVAIADDQPEPQSYFERLKRWAGGEGEGEAETIEFICKDCGVVFSLTSDHIQWFESRGWSVPKRCEECRESRKGLHDGQGHPVGEEIADIRRRLDELEQGTVS